MNLFFPKVIKLALYTSLLTAFSLGCTSKKAKKVPKPSPTASQYAGKWLATDNVKAAETLNTNSLTDDLKTELQFVELEQLSFHIEDDGSVRASWYPLVDKEQEAQNKIGKVDANGIVSLDAKALAKLEWAKEGLDRAVELENGLELSYLDILATYEMKLLSLKSGGYSFELNPVHEKFVKAVLDQLQVHNAKADKEFQIETPNRRQILYLHEKAQENEELKYLFRVTQNMKFIKLSPAALSKLGKAKEKSLEPASTE